jgi:hypothetical protein
MLLNQTSTSTETIDLGDLFPESSPDNSKSTLFSKDNDSININSEEEVEDETSVEAGKEELKKVIPATAPIVSHETLNLDDLTNTEEFEEAKAGGKKADLVEFFKSKIEAGDIIPFNDYDDKTSVEDYLKKFSKKDFDELWKSNMDQKKAELIEELPIAYKNSLPPELQYAAQYFQDGGTDMKGLFKALAQVEEVKALDPEKNAREVAKQYLTATNFGDTDEINEQLDEWDDLGTITKKAQGFKPKLDKMEEDLLKQKLANQANLKVQQQQQYQFYLDNVVNAVKDEDLHGIKIDKKIQSALYSGLTQYDFVDSRGKRCTEFEYLLDKSMWVEPDYKTIAMVQWILKDREGFVKAAGNKEVNKEVENTVRLLKTEQSKSTYNNSSEESGTKKRSLQRASTMFKRT